jgi:peptidoglycan/xylan/chitin deacetylase (PgdA/CDA1 family)
MKLWDGNRAALSLTFDDALKSQLDNALPLMNQYGVRGTFFCITNCKDYPLDVVEMRKHLSFGHEVGAHSVTHAKAATLDATAAKFETEESKHALENHFGGTATSYCYPYTDAPQLLQNAVRNAGYKQARSGRAARRDKYIMVGQNVNMFDIPCFHVNDGVFHHGDIFAWIDAALERRAWLTLMFHGVGNVKDWDNVTVPSFTELMQYLKDAQQRRGLWVEPFGAVAENFRQAGQ